MSKAIPAPPPHVADLLAREKRGEHLTADEYGTLSIYWADMAVFHSRRAVMYADRGIRYSYVALACASVGFIAALVSLALRLIA